MRHPSKTANIWCNLFMLIYFADIQVSGSTRPPHWRYSHPDTVYGFRPPGPGIQVHQTIYFDNIPILSILALMRMKFFVKSSPLLPLHLHLRLLGSCFPPTRSPPASSTPSPTFCGVHLPHMRAPLALHQLHPLLPLLPHHRHQSTQPMHLLQHAPPGPSRFDNF